MFAPKYGKLLFGKTGGTWTLDPAKVFSGGGKRWGIGLSKWGRHRQPHLRGVNCYNCYAGITATISIVRGLTITISSRTRK